ncbi:MAG: efflux transporter periplasmic adaptor subunit [Paucimonas sp.]|nr:efflux transporter periplasmic adaptor subunit [Paucimonas sp.]
MQSHLGCAFICLLTAGMLAACGKPAEKVEDVRPVRAIVLAPQATTVLAEYPGEVRPRIESRLGFRVPGKITLRKVDVGARVKRGELLMQLDPQDLKLAQAQANAALRAAESNLAMVKSDLARYRDLRQKNFVSPAVLEAKETAFKSAQASFEQATAAASTQLNQTGYANLVADADGVVTAVEAEVGQVVTAGMPVLRLAKDGDKEVVIAIPEDKVAQVRNITDMRIGFWADRAHQVRGKLRELSPVADPATRTFTARITLLDAPEDIRLGMTATVAFVANNPVPVLKLPLTALLNENGATSVWVVENGTVRQVPIKLAGVSGNDVTVASGLNPGQTVVTAGVNLIKPGQKVKLLDNQASSTAASAAAATPAAAPAPAAASAPASAAAAAPASPARDQAARGDGK